MLASRPCRVALREERDLPSAVLGPVDFAALARLAAMRLSETIIRNGCASGRLPGNILLDLLLGRHFQMISCKWLWNERDKSCERDSGFSTEGQSQEFEKRW